MSEGELDRLRRSVERLMAGQREALGVIDQEVEDQESSAQETLAEVQDILSGAYEDARTILGEGGAWRTGGTKNVRGLRGKRTNASKKKKRSAPTSWRNLGGVITRASRIAKLAERAGRAKEGTGEGRRDHADHPGPLGLVHLWPGWARVGR
jgi:hypothetical protein